MYVWKQNNTPRVTVVEELLNFDFELHGIPADAFQAKYRINFGFARINYVLLHFF